MSNGNGGGRIQTAITGSRNGASSWLDADNNGADASPDARREWRFQANDDDEYGKTVVSGAALIIDWHRRRRRDETVEESVRVGALNLAASTAAPGTNGAHQAPMFTENGPAKIYKYTGSPATSPVFQKMTSSLMNSSPGKRTRNRDTNRHVTFSEPEISHVLITHDETVQNDAGPYSPIASVEKPLTVRRLYLAESKLVDQLRRSKSCFCLDTLEDWSEMYYDTPASSLSSLECILMKDTRSSKYWKFFSFAEDNIMEITTDEKEINEPLTRLVTGQEQNGPTGSNKKINTRRIIDSDSLKPFFAIRNETDSFLNFNSGTYLKITVTDYGFAWVAVERLCVDGERLADVTEEIETMAAELGLSNLADYDPMRYL